MKRFTLFIVLVLATAACAGAGGDAADAPATSQKPTATTDTPTRTETPMTAPGSLQTRVVAEGVNAAGSFDGPQAMAARDAETLQRLWREVGSEAPPQVDFTRETVVLLFAGTRPTGGWTIAKPKARIENGILVIDAPIRRPEGMATQALTNPYLVLVVDTRTFEDLRWNPR